MVKMRSSAPSSVPTCPAHTTRKKTRRRRAITMPESRKKLRSQKVLQKQVQPEKQSETIPNVTKEKSSLKPGRNPKASGKVTERKEEMKARKREKDDKSHKRSNKDDIRNPINLQARSKKSKAVFGAAEARISDGEEAATLYNVHRWTKEQDVALQNAYFQVRPSPNFWFEVSKKVSGKTAKDCFDRFYSAHPTPPITQPRSRKPTAGSPVRPISFSSPISSLHGKVNFGRGKQGLLKAHQTVRHILRRQRLADGSYEADVFPLVELHANTSMLKGGTTGAISRLPALEGNEPLAESCVTTPAAIGKRNKEVQSLSPKQKAPCVHDQIPYTTRSSIQGQVLSPEVLKAEINPGRLDRFLDILHLRRVGGKKNSGTKGPSRGTSAAEDHNSTFAHCIAAARAAIISDAKDVLKTVLHQNSPEEEEEEMEEETSFAHRLVF